jgi:hypothetical protein
MFTALAHPGGGLLARAYHASGRAGTRLPHMVRKTAI